MRCIAKKNGQIKRLIRGKNNYEAYWQYLLFFAFIRVLTLTIIQVGIGLWVRE
jgi:hypothetical protein